MAGDWSTLGAVPEMLRAAYGSVTVGVDLRIGQSLLVRGGTSSVGLAAAVIAKQLGATVFSTTGDPRRAESLRAVGVDHVLIDGDIAAQVRGVLPSGVDGAIELAGTPTLPDTLRATARRRRANSTILVLRSKAVTATPRSRSARTRCRERGKLPGW